MNSQTSGISSSMQSSFSRGGQFPQEILGEFVEYLTDECHRKDLLNLSLASKNLRTEAQRVLFRSLDYPGPQYCERYYEDMETTSEAMEERPETHRLFLRAVINAPTRLGPHVRTYTSRFFVLVPANSDEHDERPLLQSHDNHWTSHCELWNLTARALPLLTQLKHLTLFLDTDWKGTAEGSGLLSYCATSILRRCSFSLHSFSWVYNNGLLNGADDLAEFLSCQPNLQSLNLSSDPRTVLYADRIPQFQINPGALSRLRRVSGPPSLLLTLLSGRRHINAVTWSNSIYDNNHILNIENWQALQGLKYLSLPDTKILHAICPILSSVETLYVKQVPVHWVRLPSLLTTFHKSRRGYPTKLKFLGHSTSTRTCPH